MELEIHSIKVEKLEDGPTPITTHEMRQAGIRRSKNYWEATCTCGWAWIDRTKQDAEAVGKDHQWQS